MRFSALIGQLCACPNRPPSMAFLSLARWISNTQATETNTSLTSVAILPSEPLWPWFSPGLSPGCFLPRLCWEFSRPLLVQRAQLSACLPAGGRLGPLVPLSAHWEPICPLLWAQSYGVSSECPRVSAPSYFMVFTPLLYSLNFSCFFLSSVGKSIGIS